MKKKYVHKSRYFCGNEISSYELDHGYINYSTLVKAFDAVLCNDITKLFYSTVNGEYNEPELYNGSDCDDETGECYDIYQYYIISDNGARLLEELTDEIVYYIPALDIYVWGVTHFGTPWQGVLTDIKIELDGGVK